MKIIFSTLLVLLTFTQAFAQQPVRIAIAGLSHGHVDWIFNRRDKKDVILAGIYEPNKALAEKYAARYKVDKALFFTDLGRMLEEVKPQAVSAFGPTNEHINIVRACAPLKIHVMVEKPLATTFADAREIQSLAAKHGTQVLTNFETSWYASNQHLNDLSKTGRLGEIRKVLVNDGHQGPKEIGVSSEFLEILTDPVKNGGGALTDFGCYGANLMTWLMNGERPLSVTAVTHQNKPAIYKRVDDETTIILQYSKAQCIIQASWNWTFSRKDMEVYGTKGYAIAADGTTVRQRLEERSPEQLVKLDPRSEPYNDPFSYLAAVISGRVRPEQNDQYGLPVNVLVVEILEAARESAKQNKTIFLQGS
ncbi:Gfo/Idh/MocA family oxidoreductase [Flavihumibacter sp. R14]|nr:Gfo/Idh/MocA family oxidoreductase [Flavihumibacter soli]